ncbi:MAG: stage III sporulation AC/AD family protein [Clostridia bacterium]|nr:stage III sporulation AC/AD family protein [Clostridia bacterium]
MENIKVYGIVICALCVCVLFKNMRVEYSLFIRLGITISVSIISIAVIYPALTYINEISKGTQIERHLPSLVKALGIASAVQITADICRDAGEEALASRVFLFGQAEIIILSLPIIKNLFELCTTIMR